MYLSLVRNHVLANLAFALVIVVGFSQYARLPRQQDPTINFNWIQITTALPGAAAEEVEKLVTDPLEDALAGITDIKFVSSTSREGVSSILVRFQDLDERTFDKRVADLRREIDNKANAELPDEATEPFIFEVTTANAFPTATVLVTGPALDENLRAQARRAQRDIERLTLVDRVQTTGLLDPEIQIRFQPRVLESYGLSALDVADAVRAHFRDVSAGTVRVGDVEWLVRLIGKTADPETLARLPVVTGSGEVPLGQIARVERARERPERLVSYNGDPAVMLSVMKRADANVIRLVEDLRRHIEGYNELADVRGVRLVLVDDQTEMTRNAVGVMQNNALIGLVLVLLFTWLFVGSRMAFLTTLGIPLSLAGAFWVLALMGQSLNVMVLLGVVISLGMLVDDAVVVAEAIYYRMVRGMAPIEAIPAALREVAAPVLTSVMTTVAAFLPLMLMPGILGKFMMVVPLVVAVALLVSLLEAFWLLPAHVHALKPRYRNPGRVQQTRQRITHALQIRYTRALVQVLRYPRHSLAVVALILGGAAAAVGTGLVRFEFFAFDTVRLFYVNVEMPPGVALDRTLERVRAVEARVRAGVRDGEVREIVSYAGTMFTDTEPLFGDHVGQVLVSLHPKTRELRDVAEMIADLRASVTSVPGPRNISFLELKGGPPAGKPINVKVRGTDFAELRAAADALKQILAGMPEVRDIADDDYPGREEMRLKLDADAVRRAGIDPAQVARLVRLLGDGEVVSSVQVEGEKVEVRVRMDPGPREDVRSLLREGLPLPGGGRVPLAQLVREETGTAKGNIRHYNFRRTITVEAELDKTRLDTRQANDLIRAEWDKVRGRFPGVSLDFTGELDDIQESLDSIAILFVLGVGLIYLILGTQFRSYFQPLLILVAVPLAFTGVILGLLVTGRPLSLFTMYGVVALAGVSVNTAIVLISAANDRLRGGMSLLHATIYAARRRLIPILITTTTTIGGLLSLATGLGGESLLWGPVATAIVWGLSFSTALTLFVIPLLYRQFMRGAHADG